MAFLCCGVKYSKNDPDTYWCIDTDVLEKPTKKTIKNLKVLKEKVEILTCKKNGCTKIQIFRYGHFKGKLQLLERPEELKGKMYGVYEADNVQKKPDNLSINVISKEENK